MKKYGKIILVLLCLILMSTVLTSCTGSGKTKLYVYNWGVYIDKSVIKDFEAQHPDIKVVYREFDTNESMYQKITSGKAKYDVLIPSDYMIKKLIDEERLMKLDMSKIPNVAKIDSRFMERSQAFDPENEYGVPYMWGTLGIVYNSEKVTKEVNSWDILWDEEYKGKMFMYNSQRDSIGVALKKNGYSLNTKEQAELDKAKADLIQQKPLVKKYVGDEVINQMKADAAWLAVVYSGDAYDIIRDNPKMKYAVPDEGSNLWFDSMVIPANSENPDLAHQFINFMCETDVAVKNTMEIGYSTPHAGAYGQLEDDMKNDSVYWPSQEIMDRCEVFYDLSSSIKAYDEIWNEVLAAR